MRETIIEFFASYGWEILLVWILIFLLPVWILYLDKFDQIALRKKLNGTWLGAFVPWASMFYGWTIILFYLAPVVIAEWLISTVLISLVFFFIPKNSYIEKKIYWFAWEAGVPTKEALNSPYKKFIMCHWWANIMYFIYMLSNIIFF